MELFSSAPFVWTAADSDSGSSFDSSAPTLSPTSFCTDAGAGAGEAIEEGLMYSFNVFSSSSSSVSCLGLLRPRPRPRRPGDEVLFLSCKSMLESESDEELKISEISESSSMVTGRGCFCCVVGMIVGISPGGAGFSRLG